MVRMLLDIEQTLEKEKKETKSTGEVVGERAIICPVGWGAAMDFNTLESVMNKNGIHFPHVRYDLSQSDDLWYGVRKVTNYPQVMRTQLEKGTTRRLTKRGTMIHPIESPINFGIPHIYLLFDDWTTSGLSLAGGEIFVAYHRDILNPYAIFGGTLNDRAGSAYFSIFKGYVLDGRQYSGSRLFLQNSSPRAYQELERRDALHFLRVREEDDGLGGMGGVYISQPRSKVIV